MLNTIHGHRLFTTLDGMRFIAALLIVTRHVPFFGDLSFPESYLAVDLFFVLSGFVIANAYERKLLNGMNTVEFLRIRAIRLYPLYLLGISLGIGASLAAFDYGSLWWLASQSVMSLFLIPHGLHGPLFPLDGPVWSLFLEGSINVVYVVALRRIVGGKLISVIVAAALALVAFVAIRHNVNPTRGSLDYGWTLATLPIGGVRVAFSFYVGVFIQRRHAQSSAGSNTPRPGNTVPWILVASVAAILACRLPPVLAPVFELVIVTCLFPCLVLAGIHFQPTSTSARIFRLGGLSSYAIYVLHAPLGSLIVIGCRAIPGFDIESYLPWFGIAFIIMLIPLCLVLDAFYDAPIRRALSRVGGATATTRGPLTVAHGDHDGPII